MAEQSKLKRPAAAARTLNDLPDDILIQILSLLPSMTAIIETSFISRRWRNIWHFIPTLEFYLDHPFYDDPEEHLRLANTITQVLLNRPRSIPFSVFRLAIRYFPNHRHRSLISSWLRYALDCGVKELRLTFYTKVNDEPEIFYGFHFSDLRNMSVKCLYLFRCEIIMLGYESFRFDSLRILELISVHVPDELLISLISKCGNLEELRLDLFDGVRNFRICSKSLKVLKLFRFIAGGARLEHSSVELHTPNLSKITIKDFYVESFTGDLSSVNEAEVIFSNIFKDSERCWGNAMNLLRGVENLKIKGFVSGACFQHGRLKHLELMVGFLLDDLFGVSALLERFPALETLVFGILHKEEYDEDGEMDDLEPFFDELSKPNETEFPSLREVKVLGFRNRMTEHLILFLLENRRVVLNKVVLVPANPGEVPIMLDPKSGDLIDFFLNYLRGLRVVIKRKKAELMREKAELVEAQRAFSCIKEVSGEEQN